MKIQPEDAPTQSPALASTKAELRRLNVNTKATVAELKKFLAELKGKSPQEMLGVVAASQLFRALVLSSILVCAGIVVFTVIPFFFGSKEEPAVTKTEAPAAPPAETPATPAPPTPATPENPAPENPLTPPANDPLSTLGVDEEKKAPPNVNPLDNNEDDFLKNLD